MYYRVIAIVIALGFSALVSADQLVLTIASSNGAVKGEVVIELNSIAAPNHVARIKQLTEEGAYNGVAFHRVIRGFMAQTGDVQFGNTQNYSDRKVGTGSSTYPDLKAEFSPIPFNEGVVGMARSRYIHSANSQFFIMTKANPGLNGQYTVIGTVSSGMNIVDDIKTGSNAQNGKVRAPDVIQQAIIKP